MIGKEISVIIVTSVPGVRLTRVIVTGTLGTLRPATIAALYERELAFVYPDF